ncbi:HD domain-containing protein [Candidatus Saccharibacteria bacterium]|nr:HD domain-containing protein [Candidatus Saccharibacteria bacterium]
MLQSLENPGVGETLTEVEQRDRDVTELIQLLDQIPLEADQQEEILHHAKQAWRFLNPSSGIFKSDDESNKVRRYRTRENSFFDDFETNWDHTCKMITVYTNLCRLFPELMDANFDHAHALKMILWHDAPEYWGGDVPINQQDDAARTLKDDNERIAMDNIKGGPPPASWDEEACKVYEEAYQIGDEAYQIIDEYKERETKTAILVKVIDILAGRDSFAKALCRYMPENPVQIKNYTGLSFDDYRMEYLWDDQGRKIDQLFWHWESRLIEVLGILDDYTILAEEILSVIEPSAPHDADLYIQLLDEVREFLFRHDTEHPAFEFFYILRQNYDRYGSLIQGVQCYPDSSDFRQNIQGDKDTVDSNFETYIGKDKDLFHNPAENDIIAL